MEAATFQRWLDDQLSSRGVKRRELARRLAAKHPEGITATTIETHRRAIYRYLDGSMVATNPTRRAYAEALGVDPATVPMVEDEEEEDLDAALDALTREAAAMWRRVSRLKKARAL